MVRSHMNGLMLIFLMQHERNYFIFVFTSTSQSELLDIYETNENINGVTITNDCLIMKRTFSYHFFSLAIWFKEILNKKWIYQPLSCRWKERGTHPKQNLNGSATITDIGLKLTRLRKNPDKNHFKNISSIRIAVVLCGRNDEVNNIQHEYQHRLISITIKEGRMCKFHTFWSTHNELFCQVAREMIHLLIFYFRKVLYLVPHIKHQPWHSPIDCFSTIESLHPMLLNGKDDLRRLNYKENWTLSIDALFGKDLLKSHCTVVHRNLLLVRLAWIDMLRRAWSAPQDVSKGAFDQRTSTW